MRTLKKSSSRTMHTITLCLLMTLLIVLPRLGLATTYYTATSGGGSCSTNANAPQQGINAALGCLSGGDTLIVQAGTYAEQLLDVVPSGTSGNPTTVRANSGDTVIIQPPSTGGSFTGAVIFSNKQYIIFDGFIVDLTNIINIGISLGGASQYITIQNCEVRNMIPVQDPNGAAGIGMNEASSNNIIRGNNVHDIGTLESPGANPIDHGIYIRGANQLIESNESHHNISHGIHMYDPNSRNTNNNIVRGNRVHDNGGRGILLGSGDNNSAYNNIVYGNGTFPSQGTQGINVGFNAPTNNTVYNNTIVGNVGVCIRLGPPGAGGDSAVIHNNICWGNGSDTVALDAGTNTVSDSNLLSTDPQFVNAGAANFHLTCPISGQRACDTGVNLSAVFTTDIEGTPRGLGSGWEMGAYEFGALPPPTNLRFVSQPQTTAVGQTLPAIRVEAQDSSGNLASGFEQNITMTLAQNPQRLARAGWTIPFVDSVEPGGNWAAANVLDGNTTTAWHTDFTGPAPFPPHTIQVDMQTARPIVGLRYLPRPGPDTSGRIAQYAIRTSLDCSAWGSPVASGTFPTNTAAAQTVTFAEVNARCVQLSVLTSIDNHYASAAELDILANTLTGIGTLAGTLVRQATSGAASFPDLSLNSGGLYGLRATSAGVLEDTSTLFLITSGPTRLRFTAQPQTVLVGQTLPPITVRFEDGAGNLFATAQAVDVVLATCPGANLAGTVSRAAVAGTATFDNLTIATPGAGCVMNAAASGMTGATSLPFGILATPAVSQAWAAAGTSPFLCRTVGGDTNQSSVGAGSDYIHNLACTVPANRLRNGAEVKTCVLAQMSTESPPQAFLFKLRANATTLAAPSASTTPDPGLTNGTAWVCWLTTIAGVPSGSTPTYSAPLTVPTVVTGSSGGNGTGQPVPLAINGDTTWTLASMWQSAGSGFNAITPLALTMEAMQ